MNQPSAAMRYRFGTFEADPATGELRRRGLRIRLAAQPFQLLLMLLESPGQLVTREEICAALWPEGTFVDFEHGLNSAVNRIREALGDAAANPRFIETLARRGYRFIAPVERAGAGPVTAQVALPPDAAVNTFAGRILATEADLPPTPPWIARTLFILLQIMYLCFYVGALANLGEIGDLLAALPRRAHAFELVAATAGILIPVRAFLGMAALFRAPGLKAKFLRIWPFLLVLDLLWSLSPFLLLRHISVGLALACIALLVYSPFAQRSLILMDAAGAAPAIPVGTD